MTGLVALWSGRCKRRWRGYKGWDGLYGGDAVPQGYLDLPCLYAIVSALSPRLRSS